MIRASSLILISASFLTISQSRAAIFGDPVMLLGPHAQSVGGALYSLKSTHDSLLLNPAAGAFTKEYSFDGTFSTAARTLSASLFDTNTTEWGAGLVYVRREIESSDANERPVMAGTLPMTYQFFSLSVFGKLSDNFSVGLTGHYTIREATGTAKQDKSTFNGDIGALYKVSDQGAIGVVFKNLLSDKNNVEMRSIAGGAHYVVYPGVTLTASLEKYSETSSSTNVVIPLPSKMVWAAGAEYTHESGASVRAGYRDAAQWDTQWAFGGLGYKHEQVTVNYTLAAVVGGNSDKFNTHTFGLALKF